MTGKNSQPVPDWRAKAIELWGIGLSSSAIAERLRVNRMSVNHAIKAAGLRQPGEAPRQRYDCCGASSVGRHVSPRIGGGDRA